MRITGIDIERFGVWRNLSLPMGDSPLCVCYGPNEAGKTTLMRFIRGVLYGFQPSDFGAVTRLEKRDARRHDAIPCAGRLAVDDQGIPFVIARSARDASRGLVTVSERDGDTLEDGALHELLAGVTEDVFQRVFAIGLHELQELATLHNDEIVERLYHLSLGPDAQRIVDVSNQLDRQSADLLSAGGESGRLAELLNQVERLNQAIEAYRGQRAKHAELVDERERAERTITALKRRQQEIQYQLRGHRFLDQVWTPWKCVQDYEKEMATLPNVEGFPEHGLSRLDDLETELAEASGERDTLLTEANRLWRDAKQLEMNSTIQTHAPLIHSLLDRREEIVRLQQQVAGLESQSQQRNAAFEQQLSQLGDEWTAERLDTLDMSPRAQIQLLTAARTYQDALTRHAQIRNKYQRRVRRFHQRVGDFKQAIEALGGESIEAARQDARRQLTESEEYNRLRLRESELAQRQLGLRDELSRAESRLTLPWPVYCILGFFVLAGVGLGIAGIVTGVTTNGIAGAIYAMLGLTSVGLSRALKSHFEQNATQTIERLQDELRQNVSRLCETRTVIARRELRDQSAANERMHETPDESLPEETDWIHNTISRLEDLEQLEREKDRLQRTRHRLSNLRGRFQTRHREVAEKRQQWCQALTTLGLPETVDIDAAFDTWHRVLEANAARRELISTHERLTHLRTVFNDFRKRVEEVGQRLQRYDADYNAPLPLLEQWEDELRQYSGQRVEWERLRKECKSRRTEAKEWQERVNEIQTRIGALLVRGGAATREEFEKRAAWHARRQELQELLSMAKEDLLNASQAETEMAIVEEDLLAFNPDENQEQIDALTAEVAEVENELEHAFEDLGRIKQGIEAIQNDRRPAQLRFEREQVLAELDCVAEEWFGVELSKSIVDEMRTQFERTCQPETLAAASHHLKRLTSGRYHNIWTPLGKQLLRVDRLDHVTLPLEKLSGGTREQLFLSVRFALIDRLREEGVALPLVLDDVFVNFDQERTEAAIDALIEFAESGQQILLFTCHLHLAELIENKGVAPIWLPEHNAPLEERRAG